MKIAWREIESRRARQAEAKALFKRISDEKPLKRQAQRRAAVIESALPEP